MSSEVSEMIYFKSCLRCGGDMHLTSDYYGKCQACLQCGNMVDLGEIPYDIPGLRKARDRVDSQAA